MIEKILEIFKDEVKPLYCVHCGGFLGYHVLYSGMFMIKCRRCKNFTIVTSDIDNESLTNNIIGIRLPEKGTRTRKA